MIRVVFRLLGGVLLLAGVALLGRDLLPLARGAGFAPEALGALWAALDPASLDGLREANGRYLFTGLWDHGVLPVLQQPAFAVGIVFGALLLLLTRSRARSRYRGLR